MSARRGVLSRQGLRGLPLHQPVQARDVQEDGFLQSHSTHSDLRVQLHGSPSRGNTKLIRWGRCKCYEPKVVSSNPDPPRDNCVLKSLFWQRKMVAVKPRQWKKNGKARTKKNSFLVNGVSLGRNKVYLFLIFNFFKNVLENTGYKKLYNVTSKKLDKGISDYFVFPKT